MLTLIVWFFFVPLILGAIAWLASVFIAVAKPTRPNRHSTRGAQEDKDLEFITKLITFDFFFFDW